MGFFEIVAAPLTGGASLLAGNGLTEFMLGDDTASKRQDEIYNRLANADYRKQDFNRYAGSALNNLASRGIVNSSVTSSALANAAAQAERDYLNTQMGLANLAFSQQDSPGALHGILGGFTQGLASGLGSSFGGLFG